MASDLSSYDHDPTLYLFTSLTAGSSHIVTATSRIETILKANRIPFTYVDTATDERARKLYGRRGGGKKLPLLVREGYVLGDLDEVEEWNEFDELLDNIGDIETAPAANPTKPYGIGANASSTPEKKPAAPPAVTSPTSPSVSSPKEESGHTLALRQLGTEAAAIAKKKQQDKIKGDVVMEGKGVGKENEPMVSPAAGDADAEKETTKVETKKEEGGELSETPAIEEEKKEPEEGEESNDDSSTSEEPHATSKPTEGKADSPTAEETKEPEKDDRSNDNASTSEVPATAEGMKKTKADESSDEESSTSRSPDAVPEQQVESPSEALKSEERTDKSIPSPIATSSPAAATPAASGPASAAVSVSSIPVASPPVTGEEPIRMHRGSSVSIATDEEIKQVEAAAVILEDPDEDGEAQGGQGAGKGRGVESRDEKGETASNREEDVAEGKETDPAGEVKGVEAEDVHAANGEEEEAEEKEKTPSEDEQHTASSVDEVTKKDAEAPLPIDEAQEGKPTIASDAAAPEKAAESVQD